MIGVDSIHKEVLRKIRSLILLQLYNMKVSVIIANRNDLQMLLVSVLSAVEALDGIDGEVVVVNNSTPAFNECVSSLLAGQIKDGTTRLIEEDTISSAKAMERAAQEAKGEFLFYVDSHSFIGLKTITACLRFFRRHEGEPIAFCHAPIQWAHNSSSARKLSFRQHRNALGSWGWMGKTEQKIMFKGMPHMISKEVYNAIGGYGCLAKNLASWGGLIPYLGWKPWLLGYENWGIPHGVAYHFGEYPQPCREHIKYRLYGNSGKLPVGGGHAIAAYVCGGEEFLRQQFAPAKMDRYFATVDMAVDLAKRVGSEERQWMKENQKHTIFELLENPPWTF